MIKGIGVDVVEVARFENQNQEALARKILTEAEHLHYSAISNAHERVLFLASRFAAKEAVFKAVSHFYKGLFFRIEIRKQEDGRPFAIVEDRYVFVSLSHERNTVVAFAICEES